jgi:hypothetical protein
VFYGVRLAAVSVLVADGYVTLSVYSGRAGSYAPARPLAGAVSGGRSLATATSPPTTAKAAP